MDIVSWTFENEHLNLDKPIYIDTYDPTRTISTRQARNLARQLVSGYQKHDVQHGDCICVISFNEIHYTPLFLGIIGSGASFTARELSHHIKITNSSILLTELKTLPVSIEAAAERGIPRSKIFILILKDQVVPAPYLSWRTLLQHGKKDWLTIDDLHAPAAIVSTSETSGLPKAAIIPHSYLISQGTFQETMVKEKEELSTLIAVPPFHVFTMPVQHTLPLRTCSSACIMPRFEEKGFIHALEAFKITQTVIVPHILMALTRHSSAEMASLRKVFVGGSVTTGGMQQQSYSQMHPDAKVIQACGMTEAGWATTSTREEKDKSGSVGQAVPDSKLRLVDSNGTIITKDEEKGEVQIYSATAMRGYLNNTVATTETFASDGWIRTGDIGYVKNENWYIVDRIKDLIKVRGWQVSPAEIEAALLEHPDIVDAGVIGIPAEDGSGQSPAAFIKRNEGRTLDLQGVRTFLATVLARYKNVEKVEFVDRIPRNPRGKILRRVLRETKLNDIVTKDMNIAQQYRAELQRLHAAEILRTSVLIDSRLQCINDSDSIIDRLKSKTTSIEVTPTRKRKRTCLAPLDYLVKIVRRE